MVNVKRPTNMTPRQHQYYVTALDDADYVQRLIARQSRIEHIVMIARSCVTSGLVAMGLRRSGLWSDYREIDVQEA